ncbi:hypothetical protein SKAU_G00149230 [Synaphobranchus kaupii]|uniref:Glycine N-acyltransferase-like protein n=1 Tax=Synaphobranchus kaupii TaxID=118154 RepID=A0A9Q1J2V6_SYNKA|nr:hypothetical protein SKAU_G00149230 [Synaphobranchus kaupii]
MLLLDTEELKSAEHILKGLFPESIKVYGCLFNINRGVDIRHLDAVKELAVCNNTPTKMGETVFVMTLEDASHLKGPERDLASGLSTLTTAHAEMVNSVWKYESSKSSYNSVVSYISNYPSLCVTAEDGTPLSWLLLYHHGALGRLYTVPEHRRKGHARLLLSTMARALLEQGRPVYGFVEDDNDASYSLFTSLGFSHKPDYRAVWFQLNPR